MKIHQAQALVVVAFTTTAVAATHALGKARQLPGEIFASSRPGRSILSQSRRRLKDTDADEDANAWVAGYSLKFQGCSSNANSLNLDANDEDGAASTVNNVAHFRLCPAGSCQSWVGGGCDSNYGDYAVDLATFANAFAEEERRSKEYQCEKYKQENCNCGEEDIDGVDGVDRESCEYGCFATNKNMEGCVDRSPYDDDEQANLKRMRRFAVQDYMECKQWETPDADDDTDEEVEKTQVQYYIGPYCSDDGASINFGLYADETCTAFADDNHGLDTYKELSYKGTDLPYGTDSLIPSDCFSCIKQEDPNRRLEEEEEGVGKQDPELSEYCGTLYQSAVKCESNVNTTTSGMISDADTMGCSYLNVSGIPSTELNGGEGGTVSGAAAFAAVSVAAFAGLAGLAYSVKKRIQRQKGTPLLDIQGVQLA